MRVDVAPVELRSAARALAAPISSGWLFGVDVLLVSNPRKLYRRECLRGRCISFDVFSCSAFMYAAVPSALPNLTF